MRMKTWLFMMWMGMDVNGEHLGGVHWRPSDIGSYSVLSAPTVNFQIRKMSLSQNIVGPQIKALRLARELTQGMLAARCGMLGWDVSENVITKIETQIRCVVDVELLCLARALRVEPEELLPRQPSTAAIKGYFADR